MSQLEKKYIQSSDWEEQESLWLRGLCTKALPVDNAKFLSLFTSVRSQIQNGPTCGLVTASMAASIFDCEISSDELFKEAKRCGFTKQGEMFSADDLAQLLEKTAQLLASVIHSPTESEMAESIVTSLRHKRPVLVPYDCDFSGDPCCKRGTKAHWALLLGLLAPLDDVIKQDTPCVLDAHCDWLYHWSEAPFPALEGISDVFVYAKHSKSKYPRLWRLQDLVSSNFQLLQPNPKLQAEDFVLQDMSRIRQKFIRLQNKAENHESNQV